MNFNQFGSQMYIELPRASFDNLNSLAIMVLTQFSLLIHYDIGTEVLSSLKKSKSTHVSNHIHEWRHRRRLVNVFIPYNILAEWFMKSLLPIIMEDVSKGGVSTEE